MIGVTVQCRLGNQLFQYAFAKAQAKKFNTSFFLNESLEKFTAAEYFYLKGFNRYNNLFNKIRFKFSKKNLTQKIQNVSFDSFEDPAIVMSKLGNDKSYGGYFQSARYFENIDHDIRNHIRVKDKYVAEFDSKYKELFASNKIIAIHFRRTDYLDLGPWWEENLGSGDLTLNQVYYEDCLKNIPDYQSYRIVIVGDDLTDTSLNTSGFKNAIFTANSPIIDFQIMMNADICIISNSSFAWWAAYLNSNPAKKIFCPNYWLGFKIKKEYPHSMIPNTWTKININ